METQVEGSGAWEADETAEPHGESAEDADGRESFAEHLALAEGRDRPDGPGTSEPTPTLEERVMAFRRQSLDRESTLREEMKQVVVAAGGIPGSEQERPETDQDTRTGRERLEDWHRVHLVGLEHATKSADSLRDKFSRYEAAGMSGADIVARIKDALRYTIQLPDDQYSAGAWKAIEALTAQGHELLEVRNFWEDKVYRGVNTSWRDHASELNFEVQFHTPIGFLAKQATHPIYKVQRELDPTKEQDREKMSELQNKQAVFTHFVAVPPGAETIVGPRDREQRDAQGQDQQEGTS
ncbi:hypothetical protein YW5DRAFT_03029 [Streptomyces sp. Ncost-T6T-1]|uniref:hypothetical protein n=1 Tax=Streptomyces sp. Ncost-T6T-1 TaxID=1100828 RepID=UPI0008049C3A|nr:hypothetical protein [Streptomyces sp. Ncost-T6T-1]SBV05627.1 hypothetical protein YW5DRAFT_03029 [Streptomyces sp. Ncost-T6T-1]